MCRDGDFIQIKIYNPLDFSFLLKHLAYEKAMNENNFIHGFIYYYIFSVFQFV
jgi:LEA14-like dessication related protein